MNPVSGKYEVYLVEQFKAAVGESVKLLFTRELPPEEQVPLKLHFATGRGWSGMLLLGPLLRRRAAGAARSGRLS